MPRPGAATAALHTFTTIALDAHPIAATELIAQICLQQGWAADLPLAQEYGERWVAAYLVRLRREIDVAVRQSRPIRFALNSSSEYLVQGACFVEPGDSEDVRAAKLNRLHYLGHLNWLRDLQPELFECVCRGILTLIGGTDVRLTPRSGDQGIDFFGRLRLQGRLEGVYTLGGMDQRLSVWLIGQAKRYEAIKVATPDLRELVGSIELARTQSFAGSGRGFEDLTLRPCDPVFYLFFTTGEISRDGWDLLEKTGMIGLNGEMIAVFLADNGVGINRDQLSIDELNKWAQGFSR